MEKDFIEELRLASEEGGRLLERMSLVDWALTQTIETQLIVAQYLEQGEKK